ncbi:MAG: hypothetical protein Q7J45_01410 [bacterium]|nr:hypothetical protein [bacterium]
MHKMNFESRMADKIDRERARNSVELSPSMALAHEKAKNEIFTNSDYFIHEADLFLSMVRKLSMQTSRLRMVSRMSSRRVILQKKRN